jgi:hypothetical protein
MVRLSHTLAPAASGTGELDSCPLTWHGNGVSYGRAQPQRRGPAWGLAGSRRVKEQVMNRVQRGVVLGFAALLAAGVFSGCILVGGGSKITTPTKGQELTDLKIAHDTGAINDQEYANARAKILNSNGK